MEKRGRFRGQCVQSSQKFCSCYDCSLVTVLEISCEQADKNKQHLGAFLIPQTYATVACQIAWDQFECTAGERPSFQIGGHPVYFLLRLHLAARRTKTPHGKSVIQLDLCDSLIL